MKIRKDRCPGLSSLWNNLYFYSPLADTCNYTKFPSKVGGITEFQMSRAAYIFMS